MTLSMEIPIVPLTCHIQQGIIRNRTQQSQRLSVATVESLSVQTNAAVLGRCSVVIDNSITSARIQAAPLSKSLPERLPAVLTAIWPAAAVMARARQLAAARVSAI